MGNATVKGYPDTIGKHACVPVDHTGPSSYTTGGETLTANGGPGSLGGLRSLDMVLAAGVSVSGNYCVEVQYTTSGASSGFTSAGAVLTTCKLIWLYSPLNALSQTAWTQVAASTNLSGETIRLLAFGG